MATAIKYPVMLTGGHLGGTIVNLVWKVNTEQTISDKGINYVYRRVSDDNNPETPDQAVFVRIG